MNKPKPPIKYPDGKSIFAPPTKEEQRREDEYQASKLVPMFTDVEVGDLISLHPDFKTNPFPPLVGVIDHIIVAGKTPDPALIEQYYTLNPSDRGYRSYIKPCDVDRLLIHNYKLDDEGFLKVAYGVIPNSIQIRGTLNLHRTKTGVRECNTGRISYFKESGEIR